MDLRSCDNCDIRETEKLYINYNYLEDILCRIALRQKPRHLRQTAKNMAALMKITVHKIRL